MIKCTAPQDTMSCLLLLLLLLSYCIWPSDGTKNVGVITIDVGVLLDLDTAVGKMTKSALLMAIEDYYASHNCTTRIVPHVRDVGSDVVDSTSAAIDLLKNVQVHAMIGPMRSSQANFVLGIGNKANVPIVSQAASPALSTKENPYFIRAAVCSSSQAKAIAAIVQAFSWTQVVFVYEDSNFGTGVVPYLTDALLRLNIAIPHQSVISILAGDDAILKELYKLMTMQTRVFVVHMSSILASRFFLKAKEAGMMSKGYAWIITDTLTTLLSTMDSEVIDSMQGVLGMKYYIPKSDELGQFLNKYKRRFRVDNPDIGVVKLNAFGLWAYDSAIALAMAGESAGLDHSDAGFNKPANWDNVTDLAAIGTSNIGPKLLPFIQNVRMKGPSGDFHIVNGQLNSSGFQIVNLIGKRERRVGFWTDKYGFSSELDPRNRNIYKMSKDDLGAITWPGETRVVPKGWEWPTNYNKLRIGVPVQDGFNQFIKVEKDPQTNAPIAHGFCVDVFKAVIESLPYAVPYEFVPFETLDGKSAGDYDDLVYQIFLEKFDTVVGDVTIVANRSRFVDFTLPFTESGVSMIVPIKDDERKNAWIFMKPLTKDLWLTTGAFFIFTGIVVWVLEHRVNKDFRGPPSRHVGMIFWFSFSTLVFAQKEKVISNLSRFVVIVWMFVVLVLTSSYTASLTSMLTVEKLQPTITDINDLVKNGDYVGYQQGSFVAGLLRTLNFDASKIRAYSTLEEYDEALSKGSSNGGVAAIIDEIPYTRLFLAKYCTKYTAVGPAYKAAGFGFAFPKGSPLVPEFSRAILNVTEGGKMKRISREWLEEDTNCAQQDGSKVTSDSLTLESFKGLFIIAGLSSFSALIIFLLLFLNENWDILASSDTTIKQKLFAMAKSFDKKKENPADSSKKGIAAEESDLIAVPEDAILVCPPTPAVSFTYNVEESLSQDEGLSTTEPNTPIHNNICVTDIIDQTLL